MHKVMDAAPFTLEITQDAPAAHYAGIHITAYEIDPDYFHAAKARIARETSQAELFSPQNTKQPTKMTKSELLDMLTKLARKFRADTGHYARNSHMHDIKAAPPQEMVDAVLTGFINAIGFMHGVDYALYASDLAKDADGGGQNESIQAEEADQTVDMADTSPHQ